MAVTVRTNSALGRQWANLKLPSASVLVSVLGEAERTGVVEDVERVEDAATTQLAWS